MPVSEIDQNIIASYPKLNPAAASAIYDQTLEIITEPPKELTPDQRLILEKYEGRGNNYTAGKIDEGLVHQFYTPYIVCKKAVDLAKHYGFKGGNVLEPACGTGRFFKYLKSDSDPVELYGFDLDEANVKIASLLYPDAKIYKQEFETAFLAQPHYSKAVKKSWLPEMDLVIGNPPYGDYAGYYKTYMPKLYSRFEFLFIRLGLQVLKPGGLLIFIISQNFMNNGGTYSKMKENILDIGEFVDAIRLPGKIFAGTDIGTDLVIFRKK